LQLPKLCAKKASTLVNRFRWLLFYQRQLSLPIQTLMALSNEIGGQGTSGRLHLAGKGRHWPPQKNPAAPGHESLDGRIRSREGGSDPSVVGELMGAR
jgi:hypothetical protein